MTNTANSNGWPLLAGLTFLNILNFADRYLLIAFSPAIVKELELTNFQFGLLTGIVFTGVYTLFGMFAGSLADRVHRPRLIAAGLVLWSGLTAITGITRNFAQMAAARMLIGVGEACLTPASMSLLAERFAPARRAMAGGIYYMGYPLGIGGSFIFAGMVGPELGWRGSFILLGAVGIVAALLLFLLVRDPARQAAGVASLKPAGSFADSFRGIRHELGNNPAFRLTLIGCTVLMFALGGGILDLLWWIKERGYAAAEAQKILGSIFLFGGTLGAFAGGVGADWAHQRWAAGRLRFLGWALLVAIPVIVAYRLVPGHTSGFYAAAFIASALTLLVFGPALSVVQELVPVQHRASAVALWLLCGALIGAGGGNATAGWLADAFAAAGNPEPLTMTLLVMAGIGGLSIPVFFLAARAQVRGLTAPGKTAG